MSAGGAGGDAGGGTAGEEGDEGLQAERTELAWIRTALACGALAAVTIRLGDGPAAYPASVGLGAVVGALGGAAAALRIGALRRDPRPVPAPHAAVALLVASVVVADLLALVTILL